MKFLFRLLLCCIIIPGAILLTGCEDANNQSNGWDNGNASAGDYSDSGYHNGQSGEEEIVRDSLFHVVEKRQKGGQLVPSGEVSSFDERPRMVSEPIEYMIIVQGNMTGQKSAYLLPASDYRAVRVGNRLLESTLARWESTGLDHIPPPAPPPESPLIRSRTGGAAENLVY